MRMRLGFTQHQKMLPKKSRDGLRFGRVSKFRRKLEQCVLGRAQQALLYRLNHSSCESNTFCVGSHNATLIWLVPRHLLPQAGEG
jgi:hypothetical protein